MRLESSEREGETYCLMCNRIYLFIYFLKVTKNKKRRLIDLVELCSSVDCLYVFCIFAVINVNIYYAEFLFVLIIVSFSFFFPFYYLFIYLF